VPVLLLQLGDPIGQPLETDPWRVDLGVRDLRNLPDPEHDVALDEPVVRQNLHRVTRERLEVVIGERGVQLLNALRVLVQRTCVCDDHVRVSAAMGDYNRKAPSTLRLERPERFGG